MQKIIISVIEDYFKNFFHLHFIYYRGTDTRRMLFSNEHINSLSRLTFMKFLIAHPWKQTDVLIKPPQELRKRLQKSFNITQIVQVWQI